MEQGLLWFDNSSRTLSEKVKLAAHHFQRKYGRTPDLCLVHPGQMEKHDVVPFYGSDIHVRPYRSVLPGHLWIGIDEAPAYTEARRQSDQAREKSEMQEVKGAEEQMGKGSQVAA